MKSKDFLHLKFAEAEEKFGSSELELAMETFELNICDKCTSIELSKDLFWPEYMDLSDKEYKKITCNGTYTAICENCYTKAKGK